MPMPSKRKVLFLTYPEHGQANIHLSTIASLQSLHPDIEVHLCSLGGLRRRCPHGVVFHEVAGVSMAEYVLAAVTENPGNIKRYMSWPGLSGVLLSVQNMSRVLIWNGPESYLERLSQVQALLQDLQPDLAIVDTLFLEARDALDKWGGEYIKFSPQGALENARDVQEAGIFKHPALGTGYSYPVPYRQMIPNAIAIIVVGVWCLFLDPLFRKLTKIRHQAGYPGPIPLFAPPGKQVTLCMSAPAADYPCDVTPPNVIPCGPILQKSRAVSEVDPELGAWLKARPTILIVLGSHLRLSETHAKELLRAVKSVLSVRPDIQVLWKLQKLSPFELDRGFQKEAEGRLRVVDWLEADPRAVLNTGQVVCFVNHGGANSFQEGLSAGVPQVIVPPWWDCYDNAARAEYLGVGLWATRRSAPFLSEAEMRNAILQVVGPTPHDPIAEAYRTAAESVRGVVKDHWNAFPSRHLSLSAKPAAAAAAARDREGSDNAADWIYERVTR